MQENQEVSLVIHYNEESKEQKVKIYEDFNETKRNILSSFGIDPKEMDNYALKIPDGGLIEHNKVIFNRDKLWIIPVELSNEPTGYTPMDEGDLKIKEEQMKGINLDPKDKDSYKNFHFTKVLKCDYDILEWLLLTKQYIEYHALTDVINKKWALPLGFSMKLVRPPKSNKDGTKTIRLYWFKFNRNNKKENGKENVQKTSDANDDEDNCRFGITFKQDFETKIWLLYQEFDSSNFVHNHKWLDRPTNLELNLREYDVEECCKKYKNKIKSLVTLQRLIDSKNDLFIRQKGMIEEKIKKERNLKIKQEFQKPPKIKENKVIDKPKKNIIKEERKDGVRSARNISSQQELLTLIEILNKKNEQISGYFKIEEEKSENGKQKVNKLFYSNELMRKVYYRYRDFIYVHRRMNDTRFKKILTLIIGIDNNGLNRIYAIALISKDDVPSSEWIFKHFNDYMGKAKPRSIIIERNKNVHKALVTLYNGQETSIVYCPYYIHKSLKFEFESELKTNNEPLFENITSIPIIESQAQFETQLSEVKNYAMMTNVDRHRNLILKLESEKTLWAAWYQKHLMLGGVVVWDRIAKIKSYLKVSFARYSKTPVSEALDQLLDIDKIDLRGHPESRTVSFKHNQIFMNFKLIRNLWNKNLVSEFAKERIKWYASKSFKYEIIDQDDTNKLFYVQKKKELGGIGKVKSFGDEVKVIWIVNSLFWTCLGQFSTGFPWGHEFAVHMKYPDYEVRLNKRWFNDFTKADLNVDQINTYFKLQQGLRSSIISYMKDLKSQKFKITDADFSFKTASLCSSPVTDIKKIVEDADGYLKIPSNESSEEGKDLNEEQLMELMKKIDTDNIDFDELERLISIEEEDISKDDDPNEKYGLGNEFNKKISPKRLKQIEERKKREDLKVKLKEEKQKKREAKSSAKKQVKQEENDEEEEKKVEEKKIVKISIQELMKGMNNSSKLNFAQLLLESRKRSEEERKVKEEERSKDKSSKKKKKSSKKRNDEDSDDDSKDKSNSKSQSKNDHSSESKSGIKRQKIKEEESDDSEDEPTKKNKKKKKWDDSDSSYH